MHTLGGLEMMRAAAQARDTWPGGPKLLGVTILTSMDAKAVRRVGIAGSPAAEVLRLAKLAQRAGLDGVVTSTHEVKKLRKTFGEDFMLLLAASVRSRRAASAPAMIKRG